MFRGVTIPSSVFWMIAIDGIFGHRWWSLSLSIMSEHVSNCFELTVLHDGRPRTGSESMEQTRRLPYTYTYMAECSRRKHIANQLGTKG